MRTTFLLGFLLLAALAGAPASCSSDDDTPQNAAGSGSPANGAGAPGAGGGGGGSGGSGGGGGGSGGPIVPGPGALRNVDVTVLYPLPSPGEEPWLLGAGDAGTKGALLTAEPFEGGLVPELDERSPHGSDAERLASLRVVAVRFDPCEGEVAPPPAGATCRADLRLVWQSLRREGDQVVANDGALHTFYRLSGAEFDEVLRELRAARAEQASDPPGPLEAHPRLRSEGLDGPYARRLKALVTNHAGAANLTRVTHFRRLQPPDAFFPQWSFELRDRLDGIDGAWQSSTIATTNVTRQTLTTIVGGSWDANIDPAPTHADRATDVLRAAPADQPRALEALARVLSPRAHSSESIDCATCHIAPDVAAFAENTIGLPVRDAAERFRSPYPLETAPKDPNDVAAFDNVHMLSYAGRSLSVSERVANETAAVLEALNGR